MKLFSNPCVLVVCAVLAAVAAEQARASGILVARFGGEYGHPTTADPSAMYYNPAGLALSSGTRIHLNGVFAYRTVKYDRPAESIDRILRAGDTGSGTPEDGILANAGRAELTNFLVSPFIGVVSDLGVPNLGIGLGFYVPFGGQAQWDQNDAFAGNAKYPGAVDGVQRWAGIDGTLRSLYATLAAGYRLPGPRVSFGVGLNVIANQMETVRARNADGSDDLLTSTGDLQEGRSYLEASGITFGASVGVIWQPDPQSWVGVSYQSQPGFGQTKLTGTMESKLGSTGATPKSDIEVEQELPDVIRFGGRYRPRPDIELRASAEYVRWSVMDRQCILNRTVDNRSCKTLPTGEQDTAGGGAGIILVIDREWSDAFGGRIGGSYWLKPEVELLGGVGYDGNAVPDRTLESTFIDMEKITASFGARWEVLNKKLLIDTTVTSVFFFERSADPRARDATSGRLISAAAPSRNPDGAGTYNQYVAIFNLGVEYRF